MPKARVSISGWRYASKFATTRTRPQVNVQPFHPWPRFTAISGSFRAVRRKEFVASQRCATDYGVEGFVVDLIRARALWPRKPGRLNPAITLGRSDSAAVSMRKTTSGAATWNDSFDMRMKAKARTHFVMRMLSAATARRCQH